MFIALPVPCIFNLSLSLDSLSDTHEYVDHEFLHTLLNGKIVESLFSYFVGSSDQTQDKDPKDYWEVTIDLFLGKMTTD